jgi:gluconate 5-dehydrogenase
MAKALANQGCNIVAVARRQEMLDKVVADLKAEYGVDALALRCDITDTDMVNDTVAKRLSISAE